MPRLRQTLASDAYVARHHRRRHRERLRATRGRRGVLEFADRDDGIELAVTFAGIVAKARLSRRDRDRRQAGDSPLGQA
jgi:hypothetical protein